MLRFVVFVLTTTTTAVLGGGTLVLNYYTDELCTKLAAEDNKKAKDKQKGTTCVFAYASTLNGWGPATMPIYKKMEGSCTAASTTAEYKLYDDDQCTSDSYSKRKQEVDLKDCKEVLPTRYSKLNTELSLTTPKGELHEQWTCEEASASAASPSAAPPITVLFLASLFAIAV